MEFCFELMPATRPDLAGQLARGLDLRTELKSRGKLLRFWKDTDDLITRRKKKSKVSGILFLIIGIVLVLMGASTGGFNGRLIGGVIALFIGISQMTQKVSNPPRKCQQTAQKMLDMRRTIPYARVIFNEDGMRINSGDPIPYSKLDGILETEDLYLLIINNNGMFFIKNEIISGTCEEFSEFLASQPEFPFQKIG